MMCVVSLSNQLKHQSIFASTKFNSGMHEKTSFITPVPTITNALGITNKLEKMK